MNKYIDKDYDKHFDDDFEVIYDALDELDEYIDYDDDYEADAFEDDTYSDDASGRTSKETDSPAGRKSRKQDGKTAAAISPRIKGRQEKNRRNLPNLLSPAAKTVKAGGKAAGSIIRTVLKAASLLLTAIIIVLLAVSFWKGHTVYGNPAAAVAEKNYGLAAYFGFAALLLLFELISFFWILSGQKIKDGRRIRKLDTGRGLCSFVIIYAGSFLSSSFGSLIPEAPRLSGKGAVTVYGSLDQTLFILCAAGLVSCLVRKFIFH
ncbi:hypothetical protein LAJLEIBI_02963 [[Clostridium] hylemonae DSM 15053]|uniref:hypothetical protein n=1 Tax=[Clostridium] hylemonae TaxID=89153 RepID=UPI0011EDA69A|nr:hypothetical protein [[Clostridium] hylemonae]QEK18939.1 hypothetical protein LAJLEIBI_02963 [[Clostridium] hylemonae DSM 15053]